MNSDPILVTAPEPEVLRASLRWYAFARTATALVLVGFVALGAMGIAVELGDRRRFLALALVYLAVALAFVLLAGRRSPPVQVQLVAQALADIALLTLLMHASGGVRGGLAVLLVASAAGAAVLAPRRVAIALAAAGSIAILAETAWSVLGAAPADSGAFVPAGLVGAALFGVALVVNRLAQRLREQERLARERGADLSRQLSITRLVMTELGEGVLVLDGLDRVQMANRTARARLDEADFAQLAARVAAWRRDPARDARVQDTLDAVLPARGRPVAGGGRPFRLRVHVVPSLATVEGANPASPRIEGDELVVFVEDAQQLEERAQQLKLAAMGRLSASIAHEIRNPLAAIRHANGLLAECLAEAGAQRLSGIVEANCRRINQVIEDVLSIARREKAMREAIAPGPFLAQVLEQVDATGEARERVAIDLATEASIDFDPNHLRQVLANLLGNALRHASREPAAVRIGWQAAAGDRLELSVADDGPGLGADMIDHAFEPFFTTESRGTGLGLYVARELCAANDALIGYRALSDGRYRGAFVVSIAAVPR